MVIASGGGLTVRAKAPVLFKPLLSVTVTVKAALPRAGGLPVKTPFALRVSQGGKPTADHLNPPAPPAAVSVWL